MQIPDNYKVLFLQGGASQQFAMIPMNLMKNQRGRLYHHRPVGEEGMRRRHRNTERQTRSPPPRIRPFPISRTAAIFLSARMRTTSISVKTTPFTAQNIKELPNTKGKTLVADVSSCFLSEPVDVTKYGIIYGGVQKNIGPAGMVIAIIREDLITEDVLPGTPTMLTYKTHADAGSLYNTPNCYCIYMCGKVFKWLKKNGRSRCHEGNAMRKKRRFFMIILDREQVSSMAPW